MIVLRRNRRPAGIATALSLFTLCAAMLALPAAAVAAPLEGSPPEAPLPQLSFEPGSYDFGLQQANSYTSQTYVQLRNSGEVGAQVLSLEIVGSGSNSFWIGQSDCYGRYLNPNETCSVQVNFNPNDAIPYAVQLRANSEDATSFTANLSGEGGRAILGPAVDPTSFGSAEVGSPGVTKTIEVTNSGNYPGGAFIAVIAGGAIGSFHLLDENCTGVLLSPAATCSLQVNFQPLSTGVKTARLGLFGDQDGGTQVTLTGVGTEATAISPAAESSSANSAVDVLPAPRRKRHTKPHRYRSLGLHRPHRPARDSKLPLW